MAEYIKDTVFGARIDVWGGTEPPLIICESRATMGVLRDLAYQYLVPITATNGQSGGFIVTDIVPLLMSAREVLYIGDFELRGPADQIEENTGAISRATPVGCSMVIGLRWHSPRNR